MHPYLHFRPVTRQLFLDLCAIFSPEWPLIFGVSTLHQAIWPPGTLVLQGVSWIGFLNTQVFFDLASRPIADMLDLISIYFVYQVFSFITWY